ncbi:Cytochrome P450 [Mycena venus]|uniref:Cytochrome P450 n=1 Tax=Mycena venus TaxID=2733690 RepID=A0A8H6YM78_9AGAR|nr:Cytochrome P450 [Mycena venus]
MPSLVLPLIVAAATLVYYVGKPRKRPPGPPPLPLIGNLLQMPKDHEWKTFSEWARAYGDCVYFHVLGQPIVVLGSLVAAHDLLNQKVMAGELTGFARGLALMPYSARFQSLRRLIHKELSGNMLQKYWPLHEDESRILIDKILLEPDLLLDSIRHYAGSVILRVTYGYQTAPRDDKFLLLAERVMAAFSLASQPGAWAVDIIPWLRHLPSWLPGTKFKQTAAIWAQLNMDVVEGPFNWALAHQDSALLVRPNFVSTVLSQSPDVLSEDDQDLLLWAAASLFGGGADTTVAALSSFFLAMALYPEVQAAAQAELDRVLSPGQLPGLSDRPSLPYIECLMREVLRWNPIGPLGLPHLLTQDDIYKGYHLPAGSIVMVNVWSILRDPLVFPDPLEFRPERFMNDKTAIETVGCIFGFGRRACPGVHFSEASMFIAIATTLSQCKISDPVNSRGEHIGKDVEYQTGTISHPEKFRCSITPRV